MKEESCECRLSLSSLSLRSLSLSLVPPENVEAPSRPPPPPPPRALPQCFCLSPKNQGERHRGCQALGSNEVKVQVQAQNLSACSTR
jgi:hypothetical protein